MFKGRSSIMLLVVAFVEGASLMACEVISAKLIAPYYGTSLYVWTSVLGVTLGGITIGYLLGARISEKYPTKKTLIYILSISVFLFLIMPYTSEFIMGFTVNTLSIISGTLLSTTVFLFPPIVFFGMVAPVITQLAAEKLENTGKVAGTIYGVTTVGGILSTIIVGLYFIPHFGLRISCFVFASILGLCTFVYYIMTKHQTLKN